MVRQWMCGVVVAAVIIGAQGWAAPAMATQPSDYYLSEFVTAEIGAIAGGFLGLMTGWAVAQGAGLADKAFYEWPAGWTGGWSMGRSLGASVGVTWNGESWGVQGNVLMAYLLPGVMLSVFPIVGLLHLADSNLIFTAIPHLPFVPAALAVIGYNIGAKMKGTGQPASLPWTLDLPVLSLAW